jgi:hypothetical protein
MGLFSSKKPRPAPVPVRRGRVMAIVQAAMAERDAEESPAWDRAIRQHNDAVKNATLAERRAASEALRRHGY